MGNKFSGLFGIGLLILSFICFNSDPPLVTILLAAGIIAGCVYCLKKKYKGKFFTIAAMILGVLCLLAGISQASSFGLVDIPSDDDYRAEYDSYKEKQSASTTTERSNDDSSATKPEPTATPTPAPTDAPVEPVQEEQPVEEAVEQPVEKPEEKPATGLDPDLKAFLDSYESYVDEYVAFMKKYNANPTDMTLLTEYTTIMSKYTDFATKIEQYDSKEMSTEDAKYYLEVTTRCSKKMMDVY